MSLWVKIKSTNGDEYYWNPETKAVGWKPPAGADVEWAAQQTEDGKFYYWNRTTRETSWDVPTLKPRQQPQGGRDVGEPTSAPAPAGAGLGTATALNKAAGLKGGPAEEERRPARAAEVLSEAEPVPVERPCHPPGQVAGPAPAASQVGEAVQMWPFRISEQHSRLQGISMGTVPTPSRCSSGGTARGVNGNAASSFLEAEHHFAPEDPAGGHDAKAAWVEVARSPLCGPFYWNYLRGCARNTLPGGERALWRAHCIAGEEEEEGGGGRGATRVFYENLETREKVWRLPGSPHLTFEPPNGAGEGQGCRLERNLAVMVEGLRSPAYEKYNNQVGHVVCFQQDGRAMVQLADALGGPVLAVGARHLAPLPRPYPVELRGLRQAHLNGEVGTVESFASSLAGGEQQEDGGGGARAAPQQRYTVRLRDTTLKAVPATKVVARSRIWNLSFANQHRDLQSGQEQRVTFIDSKGLHNNVWVRLPSNFWSSQQSSLPRNEAWPLLVWLPGAGGGTFFSQNKKNLKLAGLQFAASTFVVVTPVTNWKWTCLPEPWVNELVESLRAADWIDHRRVYLSGCSMGGMGTWELGHLRPDLYAALAPVAAHHRPDREKGIAAELRDKPIFVVHSKPDDTCPMSCEEPLWGLLLQEGNRRLQVNLSPDLDHTSMFRSAYAVDTVLFDWLLQFQLGD